MKARAIISFFALSSCGAPVASFAPAPAISRAASRAIPTRSASSPAPLRGWFDDDSKLSKGVQAPTLTDEQDSALRDFASLAIDLHGFSWFRRPECLQDARDKFPVLADLTDDELSAAYLTQKPKILDVFFSTPLGPFLAINLILYATGFSWCDTPLGNPDACARL